MANVGRSNYGLLETNDADKIISQGSRGQRKFYNASFDDEYVSDDSDETSSGVDTLMNERRRINREYKKLDKGYNC